LPCSVSKHRASESRGFGNSRGCSSLADCVRPCRHHEKKEITRSRHGRCRPKKKKKTQIFFGAPPPPPPPLSLREPDFKTPRSTQSTAVIPPITPREVTWLPNCIGVANFLNVLNIPVESRPKAGDEPSAPFDRIQQRYGAKIDSGLPNTTHRKSGLAACIRRPRPRQSGPPPPPSEPPGLAVRHFLERVSN